MTDMDSVRRITLFEYRVRKEAHRLMELDREYYMHRQAWLNQVVQNTKKEGKNIKPMYSTFDEFFDYDNLFNANKKSDIKPTQMEGLMDILRKQKERSEQNGKL